MFRAKHFSQTRFFKKCFARNILHTKPQKTLIFPTPRFSDVSRETFLHFYGFIVSYWVLAVGYNVSRETLYPTIN